MATHYNYFNTITASLNDTTDTVIDKLLPVA